MSALRQVYDPASEMATDWILRLNDVVSRLDDRISSGLEQHCSVADDLGRAG